MCAGQIGDTVPVPTYGTSYVVVTGRRYRTVCTLSVMSTASVVAFNSRNGCLGKLRTTSCFLLYRKPQLFFFSQGATHDNSLISSKLLRCALFIGLPAGKQPNVSMFFLALRSCFLYIVRALSLFKSPRHSDPLLGLEGLASGSFLLLLRNIEYLAKPHLMEIVGYWHLCFEQQIIAQ